MSNLKYINNKRQLEIAKAALTHITFGNSFIRKAIRDYFTYLIKLCELNIDPDWSDSHSGLIAGDWKHFKSNEEN